MANQKLIVLCVLDGWGIGTEGPSNAIINANPQHFSYLLENFPNAKLHTSGKCVGLPDGQMGNSEVGHMTIGSGRIILQDLLRINQAIESKEIFQNAHIQTLIKSQNKDSFCHIIGLVSNGGVHAHIDHIIAMSKFLHEQGLKIKLHLITDGRDTAPKSAMDALEKIEQQLLLLPSISVATVNGRYYAMDRDKRYHRTQKAYEAIAEGKGKKFNNPRQVVSDSYAQNITDEFIEPSSLENYSGIKNGDSIVFMNFRSDRMRQLVISLCEQSGIHYSSIVTMTPYSETTAKYAKALCEKENIKNSLPEILHKNSMAQLKIAETEKYAHVTFFFNAGLEKPFPLEKRILIESPKVATYDLKPEMSAHALTDALISEISTHQYQFVLVNYANADMVGHTGNYEATVEAVKVLDDCLKKLSKVVLDLGGALVITADHGNAENMYDYSAQAAHTAHTQNPVPFIIVDKQHHRSEVALRDGTLADIAPTILSMYGLEIPREMTGKSLIIKEHIKTHE